MSRVRGARRVGRISLVRVLVLGVALSAVRPASALASEPASAAPSSADESESEASPSDTPPRKSGIFVELRANDPRTRIDRISETGAISSACFAPCRMVLDRDAIYVIEGEGIPATAAFSLPEDADEILLKVKAGSDQRTWIGGALVVVGTLAVGAGFGGLIASTGDGVRPAPGQPDTRHETAKIGAIMVGIGILPLFAGLILRNTARTSVVTSTGSAFTSQNGSRQTRSPIALTPQGLTF